MDATREAGRIMFETFRNLVDDLDIVFAADNSFRDFHAKGVDYICLHRTPALTVKLYLFDPATLVVAGPGRQVVNPHSHGYNFSTHVLRGGVTNVEYLRGDGDGWHEIRYGSPLKGRRWDQVTGPCSLREIGRTAYGPSRSYDFDHERIHSIEVHPETKTALLLFQHADKGKPFTLLYTRAPATPPLDGLYKRWATDDIRSALRNVLTC
jgi:hypothetical protein